MASDDTQSTAKKQPLGWRQFTLLDVFVSLAATALTLSALATGFSVVIFWLCWATLAWGLVKQRGAIVVLAIVILYVATYAALARPVFTRSIGLNMLRYHYRYKVQRHPDPVPFDVAYAWGGGLAGVVFAPIHWVDCRLRPAHWYIYHPDDRRNRRE
jgi:hypothetical protein